MRRATIAMLLGLGLILAAISPDAFRRVTAHPPPAGNPNLAVAIMFDDDTRTGQLTGLNEQPGEILARIARARSNCRMDRVSAPKDGQPASSSHRTKRGSTCC